MVLSFTENKILVFCNTTALLRVELSLHQRIFFRKVALCCQCNEPVVRLKYKEHRTEENAHLIRERNREGNVQ